MSGVKVAHAVELDSKAAETFRRNHAHTTLHNQDIRTVSKADFTGLVKNMPTCRIPDDHMVACETDAGVSDTTLSSPASAYCS